MTRILERMDIGQPVDVRELIVQFDSTEATHHGNETRSSDRLRDNYRLVESLCSPSPSSICICDDVITTGAHFKTMSSLLIERFPNIPVYGVFIARRVPQAIDFDAFFDDVD